MKRKYEVWLYRWVEQECLVEVEASSEEEYEQELERATKQAEWDETGRVTACPE